MPITDKIRESKAFYVAAGAGDYAVEKLREVPDRLTRLQKQAEAKDLPRAAASYANQVGVRAAEVVDGLAARGKRLVGRVERQQATKQLEESAKSTARKVRSAAGTAREAADSARNVARSAGRAAADASKKVGN